MSVNDSYQQSVNPKYLRRRQAAEYLIVVYGEGSEKTLAKLAVIGGGPEFHRLGRSVIYKQYDLDRWAQSRISGPFKSTSDSGVE